jgi:NAD(P)-dependent dehydrogenase (short-subunit alcohol dehydrogenase family)
VNDKRVAVVTGANRGIGFEICRQLAARGGLHVILAARDEKKGAAAAKKLQGEGLEVESHELDVTSGKEIKSFAKWLADAHGRCDVLVNNAGILVDPTARRSRRTFSARSRSRKRSFRS